MSTNCARLHVVGRILNLQDDLLFAQEALHFRATHDGLTGIPNWAAIMEALGREISRQLRDNLPFGIVLADIDHFKNVNDTYGHLPPRSCSGRTSRGVTVWK